MLLDGEEVPAGEYIWMRLKVLADPDVAGDSCIDRRRGLRAPDSERR